MDSKLVAGIITATIIIHIFGIIELVNHENEEGYKLAIFMFISWALVSIATLFIIVLKVVNTINLRISDNNKLSMTSTNLKECSIDAGGRGFLFKVRDDTSTAYITKSELEELLRRTKLVGMSALLKSES